MIGAIYATTAGAITHQTRLDALSNNLANLHAPGFKKDRMAFKVLPDQDRGTQPPASQGGAPEEPIPLNPAYGLNMKTDFSPGAIKETGNPLDLALVGNGFFCLETPEGTRYTRNGNFTRSGDGVLMSHEGYPVLGTGGKIKVDGVKVEIDKAGNVHVDGDQTGTLKIVDFENISALRKAGSILFHDPAESAGERPATDFTVLQKHMEMSNVNPLESMAEMIELLRGFESYQKMIQTLNDIHLKGIQEVGAPAR